MTEKLLTVEELAEALAVKPSWVSGAARRGALPHYRLSNRTLRFDLDEVLALGFRRLTLEEVAYELGVSSAFVLRWAEEGAAPATYENRPFGRGHWIVFERDLEKWRSLRKRLFGRPLPYRQVGTDGIVYYVQPVGGGPIKVGTSIYFEKRLVELQNSSPFPLRLLAAEPGGPARESQVHAECMFFRLHGEWFKPDCRPLQTAIKAARAAWGTPRGCRLPARLREHLASEEAA